MSDLWTWNNSDGTDPVIVLWDISSSADYDWWETAIVMNSRGEYALYTDSGCSCNAPYIGGWDSHDLSWTADLHEIKRKAMSYVGKNTRISVGRKADNLSKLSRLSK